MSPRLSSPAHPASGGGGVAGGGGGGGGGPGAGGRGRGGLSKRDKELIGQTVRIIQGPFKGKILIAFLAHLAKDNVSFCHHLASVVR